MRKEHRCKREREFEPENLHSCKNYDLLNEFEDLPRKKKKHKSHKIHKYKINEDDSFPRNCVKESSAKISEKVIHIHGSSSEEENSHSRIQERNNYKNDSDAAERHTENSEYCRNKNKLINA